MTFVWENDATRQWVDDEPVYVSLEPITDSADDMADDIPAVAPRLTGPRQEGQRR